MIGFIFLLLNSIKNQDCQVQDIQKLDCGYFGIDQQKCQAKNCCWKPRNQMLKEIPQDIPWCFYPKGQQPCQDLSFTSDTPGFEDSDYQKMYQFYIANINIQGKGGVVASPDRNTPGGSYYYHWMRDGALTMRLFMQINQKKMDKIQEKMKSYVNWVLKVQNQHTPYQYDIRTNPKFQLPNGQVYQGGWCRPQTDGPGLRSGTLIMFANILLDNGQQNYVRQNLWTSGSKGGGAIKFDLQWLVSHWRQNGCDLWQQVQSTAFFWGRMSFRYALDQAQKLATRLGQRQSSQLYRSTKMSIQNEIQTHWTGAFLKQSDNRQKDGAVTHALSSFPGLFSFTDTKVSATIKTLNIVFCLQYPINIADNKAGIPGILYGRYPGDSYAGGNPWPLLTAVLGQLLYQGANESLQRNSQQLLTAEQIINWSGILKLSQNATAQQLSLKLKSAGDSVLFRLYKYLKNDGGHVSQQINKNTGVQTSAHDLTWSYGNILSALHYRKSLINNFEKKNKQ